MGRYKWRAERQCKKETEETEETGSGTNLS